MVILTVDQIEQLEKQIAEKEEHLKLFIESANREIAHQNGQIAALKALITPQSEEAKQPDEKEPEPNGTGQKEKAKA